MARSIEHAEARIAELERVVSRLRHDVRGALSPALLMADGLRASADPRVQRAGEVIVRAVERVSAMLKGTYEAVPAQQGAQAVPEPGREGA